MKYAVSLAILLAALPFTSGAESTLISSHFYSAAGAYASGSGSASLLYTDGTGRLTAFDMESEKNSASVTIRQDGAVVWRRSFPAGDGSFSVSRRENNGRVYFLMNIGGRRYEAEPDQSGAWIVRPAGSDAKAVPLN